MTSKDEQKRYRLEVSQFSFTPTPDLALIPNKPVKYNERYPIVEKVSGGLFEELTVVSTSKFTELIITEDETEDSYILEYMWKLGLVMPVNGDYWVGMYDDDLKLYSIKFHANPPKRFNKLKITVRNIGSDEMKFAYKYRIYNEI